MILTLAAGLVDELVQGAINDHYEAITAALAAGFDTTIERVQSVFHIRYFDPRDVWINGWSGALAQLAYAVWLGLPEERSATDVSEAAGS